MNLLNLIVKFWELSTAISTITHDKLSVHSVRRLSALRLLRLLSVVRLVMVVRL